MLMKTDELGIPRFSNKDLVDLIYTGNADKCHVVLCDESTDVNKFNEVMEQQGFDKLTKYIPLDVDKETFDNACQSEWYMPDHYKQIDVLHWLFAKCMQETQVTDYDVLRSTKQWQRTREEFEEFAERKLTNLLRYMIYLVDFMRENDIVWGVGRGSSVSSYVLYLINVHKIDSIKYNLDWREFLRD